MAKKIEEYSTEKLKKEIKLSGWKATHNNGEAIKMVVHISWGFADNKVHTMGVLFDNLPGYLASNPQPADSVSVE